MPKTLIDIDTKRLNGFIIVAPPFTRQSAGVYCLYRLAADLHASGLQVFMFVLSKQPNQPLPFGLEAVSAMSAAALAKLGFAVVYPEAISGNMLSADTVVRWVMNVPGKLGGDKKFADSELVFTYGTAFDKHVENPIAGHLTRPVVDESILSYDASKIEKTDISVYIGKGKFIDGLVPKYDNLITRTKPSHNETLEILKRTKVLYTFDRVTNIANEARFLGCEVMYMPNPDQDLTIDNDMFGQYGLHVYENIVSKTDTLEYDFQRILNEVNLRFKMCVESYINQLAQLISIVSKRIAAPI